MNPAPAILIAPDSFKECLSACAVADSIARGVSAAIPEAKIHALPLSDGGEGFVESLIAGDRGEHLSERVTGPLGDDVDAAWGLIHDGRTAVLEMAQAAGLMLVPPNRRDPLHTTTFGVAELIRAALLRGVERILLGIGGSATNDGGIGMAQALGFGFVDAEKRTIPAPGAGADLERVFGIRAPIDRITDSVDLQVACDVDNPLLGERGAARTYAAQKGAMPAQIDMLEAGMKRFADVLERDLRVEVRDLPGAGAAGGLGAGLIAFAGGKLRPGADLVLDELEFDSLLDGAKLVITGEGAVNAQTTQGKAPWVVYRRARARGIPTLLITGQIGSAPPEIRGAPSLTLRRIAPEGTPRDASIRDAPDLIASTVQQAVADLMG